MDLRQRVSEELLPYVQQPGQYIGREINQLVADGDWQRADVKVAIAFPDTYTIGMSHLGCQILYWLCNHTPGVCGERVYVPWIDAEQRMRERDIPLFTWDTRQPVASADILAVSLQYEMAFTNVLTLLDLAGIPLRTRDRDDSHPLVIAGGPQADNPEPLAEFLDLVVMGDGEVSLAAILEAYKELRQNGLHSRDMIVEMARRFEWAYAPSLYDVAYHDDGTLRSIEPTVEGIGRHITRCQTPDFEAAPFPVRPLVPHVDVVHDRIAIEIMRGCPQLCRFCHAGYTKRPLRLRSVDKILDMAEEAYWSTGVDELGLLSLSTADYPHLRDLSERIHQRFADRRVGISIPSLRVDRMLANIPFMVRSVRKSGLTIAVEAARDDMRAAIRKKITDGNLMEGVMAAYRAGWRSVKLYFMAGFPGERPEDIDRIWDLANEVSRARKEVNGHPAQVNASVGWLVPKPHTPLQWAAQPRADYFHDVRRRLRSLQAKSRSAVRIKTHNVERSVLEAVFSRGDRKLGPTIEAAWRSGARFDAWDEMFDPGLWDRAFDQTGIDPAFYAHRERPRSELLPWSHLTPTRLGRDFLARQYDDMFVQLDIPQPQESAS
ncbi:MAG TPA: TIGR03960 family B12-binding radical SAM protein [Phycisphaerae bacterium]|nr:TIGR03960 family B12-binding radical SAM protein [Phycisphaerae bacterium]